MRGSPSTCSTRRATRISAHWDFSEDTYRTLTAVPPRFPPPLAGEGREGPLDAAPNGAKGHRGADPQGLRGRRLREVPIITFAGCHLTCVHKGVFHRHG